MHVLSPTAQHGVAHRFFREPEWLAYVHVDGYQFIAGTFRAMSGSLSHVAAAVLALLHVFCPFVSGTVPISCVLMAPLLAFLGLLPLPRLDLSWVRRDRSTEVLNFAQNSSSSLGFG
jgi:hypothetical protein